MDMEHSEYSLAWNRKLILPGSASWNDMTIALVVDAIDSNASLVDPIDSDVASLVELIDA